MKTLEGLTGLRELAPGAVVSIGNFDGVHRGHRVLLERAGALKAATGAAGVAVVTFEPHPLTVLRPRSAPPRLTPPHIKRELLAAAGVDELVVLPPSREILDLTAEQFWHIIRHDARPSHLVEGNSFSFGKGRGGNIDRLRQWTVESDIRLHVLEPVTVALVDMLVVPVSSSVIRWLLEQGRVRDAAICLGRGYALEGPVVKGAGRGRELGIPTANLKCDQQLIPDDGVYAGRCTIEGRTRAAAVSIGTNPTFGDNPRTVEAHLVGFEGDLYGRTLRLELVDWQRDQWIFPNVHALKVQIDSDIRETLARSTADPSRAIAVAGAAVQRI